MVFQRSIEWIEIHWQIVTHWQCHWAEIHCQGPGAEIHWAVPVPLPDTIIHLRNSFKRQLGQFQTATWQFLDVQINLLPHLPVSFGAHHGVDLIQHNWFNFGLTPDKLNRKVQRSHRQIKTKNRLEDLVLQSADVFETQEDRSGRILATSRRY